MFCKHRWKVMINEVTESKVEHMRNIGYDVGESGGIKYAFLERKKIIILQCEHCGALDKTIEDI